MCVRSPTFLIIYILYNFFSFFFYTSPIGFFPSGFFSRRTDVYFADSPALYSICGIYIHLRGGGALGSACPLRPPQNMVPSGSSLFIWKVQMSAPRFHLGRPAFWWPDVIVPDVGITSSLCAAFFESTQVVLCSPVWIPVSLPILYSCIEVMMGDDVTSGHPKVSVNVCNSITGLLWAMLGGGRVAACQVRCGVRSPQVHT